MSLPVPNPTPAQQEMAEAILLEILQEMQLPSGQTINLHPNMTRHITTALTQAIAGEKERCARVADRWTNSKSCDSHSSNPCCHVRTGKGIATAIRREHG